MSRRQTTWNKTHHANPTPLHQQPRRCFERRQIAGKVIARLQGKYWSFVRLDDVRWERSLSRATAHFQDEPLNPGECDIVVGVLWSRLGSPLPEQFRNLRGVALSTGRQ